MMEDFRYCFEEEKEVIIPSKMFDWKWNKTCRLCCRELEYLNLMSAEDHRISCDAQVKT